MTNDIFSLHSNYSLTYVIWPNSFTTTESIEDHAQLSMHNKYNMSRDYK